MTAVSGIPVPHETHDLPSGAKVELLAVTHLKAKHYRAVMRAVSDVEGRLGGQALDLIDGVLAMLVTAWTVTGEDGQVLPIPSVHIDSLDELEFEDYSALVALPVVGETVARVVAAQRQRPVVDPGDYDNPMSPTGPSDAQRQRLGEKTSPGPAGTTGAAKSKTPGSRSAGAGRRSK